MMSAKSLLCLMPHELQKVQSAENAAPGDYLKYSHQLTGRGRTQAGSVRYIVGRYKETCR